MQSRLIYATPNVETLIERCGRVCYGSHDKTTATSAIPFIRGLLAAKPFPHEAVIEHGRFVVEAKIEEWQILDILMASPLLTVTNYQKDMSKQTEKWIISGNARAWRQAWLQMPCEINNTLRWNHPDLFWGNGQEPPANPQPHQTIASRSFVDLWNIDKPDGLTRDELLKHGAATVFLHDVSRSLTHQLVRHRMASYCQKQQRWGQTLNSIRNIIPLTVMADRQAMRTFDLASRDSCESFNSLRFDGIPQEDARYVLSNATATEIAVTMTFEHWQNFLDLRCDHHAQWEIRRVADEIKSLLVEHAPEVFA